jgi:hypothetical protein
LGAVKLTEEEEDTVAQHGGTYLLIKLEAVGLTRSS